jgi:hypothetical protein
MDENIIIRNQDQHRAMLAERRKKSDARQIRTEAVRKYSHAEVASQAIKVVNSLPLDPFVKKVMTLRIIGPLITGHERSHMSIALELGAPIDDVIQAEEYGTEFVENAMAKCSMPDFIGKFNSDRAVENAVKGDIHKGQPVN